jgi:acyl-homoserine-lactone acylase
MRLRGCFLVVLLLIGTGHVSAADQASGAARVEIVRDDWGIAHVHGHTDADAVFGAAYAQAEDDFGRIETNYLTALGRLAEADGPGALAQDLRARLYVDPADLRARYDASPAWLQALMTGWADGLNLFLVTHPGVKPRVLRHFEPWMALSFTEGSIGGDVEQIALPALAAFYAIPSASQLDPPGSGPAASDGPRGSNGIAIAPSNTTGHHALLLINPHTSFYFRSELQMTSDEGLDAYGAATWGQFFLYQGFNARVGWMHTSSHSDAVDQYLERVVTRNGALFTRDGAALAPVIRSVVTLAYRARDGGHATRDVTIYKTAHGPVVGRAADGRWISEAMMFAPVPALEQSFGLTKARDYAGFMRVMALRANTSNNTIYADADGHIAYLHPQFIPRRDDRFDYTKPVDGADPRTAWQGLHALDEAPHVFDPATGWVQNTNDWPYSAAGSASPRQTDFPRYMDTYGENVRGLHAVALLRDRHDFTLERLVAAAYDPAQPGFDLLIPALLEAYDRAAPDDPAKTGVADQIALLRGWDRRWSAPTAPTTLAVTWGEALWRSAGLSPHVNALADYDAVLSRTTPSQRLAALAVASDRLVRDFGTWRLPWGEINRVQRLDDSLTPHFSDAAPSVAVGFTSAQWGSLASISGPAGPGYSKRYGDTGNSFVAAVEFGPRVRAVAVTAGGESGDPASPHFDDQAVRYASGALRPVYFYPEDVAAHASRRMFLIRSRPPS